MTAAHCRALPSLARATFVSPAGSAAPKSAGAWRSSRARLRETFETQAVCRATPTARAACAGVAPAGPPAAAFVPLPDHVSLAMPAQVSCNAQIE